MHIRNIRGKLSYECLMERISKINLDVIGPRSKVLAWVVLVLLTAVLLLIPVHLINEYHPIQAPYLFENLFLFGALFCIWMLLLLLLAFSSREMSRPDWQLLALTCVFGLVFLGFWVIVTPYGSETDGIYNMGHVRWLLDEGSIPVGHQFLGYFTFPGMHLLVSALSQICGLGIFEIRALFLVLNAVLFLTMLYIFVVKILKSNRLAFLGVLLTVLGSTMIVDDITAFYPRAFGYTLLSGFLLMLTRSETKLFGTTVPDRLLMLILFIAMTISYFATSLLAPLILLGIYAVQVMGKDTQARASPRTIILLLFMVVAWEMYWAWQVFTSLVTFLPKIYHDFITGEFMTTPLTLLSANTGVAIPLWARITRNFWWALLVFSTILGLRNLLRLNKLSLAEKIVTGGLLGVLVLTAIGIFGTAGGYEFSRFLLYAPLFCVPILLMFLNRLGIWRRVSLTLLAVLIFVLSLTTFLSSVNTVCTDAISPYECAVGEFMEYNSRDKGKGIILYGTHGASTAWASYYIPNSVPRYMPQGAYFSEDAFWEEVGKLVTYFRHEGAPQEECWVFVTSEKTTLLFQHLLGILPDDRVWAEVSETLSGTNKIFNNGHVQIYGR